MNLESGELDRRCTFEKQSERKDAYGDFERGEWVLLGTFWGKLSLVSDKLLNIAKGYAATVEHTLLIRYRAIEVGNRVTIGGVVYHIQGVRHNKTEGWTQCFLSSV